MSTKARYYNGILKFYDGNESINPLAPVTFYDDFLGTYLQKYTSGENTTAPWKTVETTGSVALVANEPNGIVSCAITNADSAQVACLYWGDQLSLSMKQGLIMEFRATFAVLPTTGTEEVHAVMGLASATNADLDTIATNAWFKAYSATGSGATLLWETDDGNTNDDDNDASTTLVATTYNTYLIDCTTLADGVRFYVDGVLVGTSGDMNTNLTASEAKVQPYFNVMKAKSSANTGTGTIYLDYVRTWMKRS